MPRVFIVALAIFAVMFTVAPDATQADTPFGENWYDWTYLGSEHPVHGETHHCDEGFRNGLTLHIVKHSDSSRCFNDSNGYETINPNGHLVFGILVLGPEDGLSSYYPHHDRTVSIRHVSSDTMCEWYSKDNPVNGSWKKSFPTQIFQTGRYELIVSTKFGGSNGRLQNRQRIQTPCAGVRR